MIALIFHPGDLSLGQWAGLLGMFLAFIVLPIVIIVFIIFKVVKGRVDRQVSEAREKGKEEG